MVEEGLIVRFKGDTSSLETASGKTVAALGKVQKSSSQAGSALMDFGRIAQDAAFGPMAIANNITPFLESLQRLKVQAKETGTSVKTQLMGALTGGAGLGVAFSLITAAVGFASMGLSAWTRKTQEAKEKAKEYAETLDDVRAAHLKGAQAAQEELVNAQHLYQATQNTTLSYQERKKAVDALQQQYPQYFANLKDEVIMAGGAQTAYEQLTGAIVASARARAATDKLIDIQKQILELSEKQAEATRNEEEAYRNVQKAQELYRKVQNENAQLGQSAIGYIDMINSAQKKYNASIQETTKLKTEELALQKRAGALVSVIPAGVIVDPKAKVAQPIKVKTDRLEIEPKEIRIPKTTYVEPIPLSIEDPNPLPPWAPRNPVPRNVTGGMFDPQVERARELAMVISDVVTPAFQNMFSAIVSGEAPLKAFFNSIMQSIVQLINKLIEAAIQALILSFLLPGGGGGFGAIFGKLSPFKFGKHAAGGLAYGPSIGMIGEYANAGSNPEIITPLSKLKDILLSAGIGGGGDGEFVIRGNDLVRVHSRVNRKQGRTS